MKISVALAYYDGAEFIDQQLTSILNQFGEEDELILSVDRAFDGSWDLLKWWEEKDSRIFVTQGPGKGVVRNYEHAMKMTSGELIFFSNQDDIWLPDKIKKVKTEFHDKAVKVVFHNGKIVDRDLKDQAVTLFEKQKPKKGYVKNLWQNSYVGCCMAIRRELLENLLPIPDSVYQYDYWIGSLGELVGKVAFIEEPLLLYRDHTDKRKEEEQELSVTLPKKRMDMLLALLRRKREIEDEN